MTRLGQMAAQGGGVKGPTLIKRRETNSPTAILQPVELMLIVRDQDETEGERVGGDQQIIGADDIAALMHRLLFGPYLAAGYGAIQRVTLALQPIKNGGLEIIILLQIIQRPTEGQGL